MKELFTKDFDLLDTYGSSYNDMFDLCGFKLISPVSTLHTNHSNAIDEPFCQKASHTSTIPFLIHSFLLNIDCCIYKYLLLTGGEGDGAHHGGTIPLGTTCFRP